MENNKTIIFDFDGTLADTLAVLYKAANHFAEQYGFAQITSRVQLEYLKTLSARQIVSMLRIPWHVLPKLTMDIRRYIQQDMQQVSLFPGVKETIDRLQGQGYRLGIMTSNSRRNVNICLKHNGCEKFEFIATTKFIFNKSRALKRVMKRRAFSPDNTYYVGDEARDIEAAKKSGIQAIAVTWGFNTQEQLKSCLPDALVHAPHEIIEVV